MSLRDSLPLPSFLYGGFLCQATEYLSVQFDYQHQVVRFLARCELSNNGEPPDGLDKVEFGTLGWALNEYVSVMATEVRVVRDDEVYNLWFSAPLEQVEGLLGEG